MCGAWGVFRDPGNLPDSVCPAVPAWNEQGFLEYSTTTGKVRTLYSDATSCYLGNQTGTVLWASTSGDTVVGYLAFGGGYPNLTTVLRFGIFREHAFTPLPVPSATGQGTIAW